MQGRATRRPLGDEVRVDVFAIFVCDTNKINTKRMLKKTLTSSFVDYSSKTNRTKDGSREKIKIKTKRRRWELEAADREFLIRLLFFFLSLSLSFFLKMSLTLFGNGTMFRTAVVCLFRLFFLFAVSFSFPIRSVAAFDGFFFKCVSKGGFKNGFKNRRLRSGPGAMATALEEPPPPQKKTTTTTKQKNRAQKIVRRDRDR